MFCPDIMALSAFYSSNRGAMVKQAIEKPVEQFLGNSQDTVVGVGYTSPFIGSNTAVQIIPPIMLHPEYSLDSLPKTSCVADICELPLEDESTSHMMAIHALEYSPTIVEIIMEIWRVLEPGGKILLVVPNRRGFWSGNDQTPFGYGHPFHPVQLYNLLKMNRFSICSTKTALFLPPTDNSILLKLAPMWEKIGKFVMPTFQGILIIEARKEVYALHPPKTEEQKKRLLIPASKPAITSPKGFLEKGSSEIS